jgi:hypothetical protein
MKKTWLMVLALLIGGCSAATGPPPLDPAATDSGPATSPASETTAPTAEPATPPVAGTGAAASEHALLLDEILFAVAPYDPTLVINEIAASGDTRFVAGLIDTLYFQRGLSREIGQALNTLTGQNVPADWFAWVEWAGQHPEIESFSDYPAWKSNLFFHVDPNFRRFVYEGMKVDPDSRVEEILWGGVGVDGIPALDNPKLVEPQQATYLDPDERVFGVSINGDSRAYPARFLDWHEMFNDIIGGEPVSLAY